MESKDIKIEDLGLSVRALNALHRVGIFTVEELISKDIEYIRNIRNLGIKTVSEIWEKIEYCRNPDNLSKLHTVKPIIEAIVEPFSEDWLKKREHCEKLEKWLDDGSFTIRNLGELSGRAYNMLKLNGIEKLSALVRLSTDELSELPRMNYELASEVHTVFMEFCNERQEAFNVVEKTLEKAELSAKDMLSYPQYREKIIEYIKANDKEMSGYMPSQRLSSRLSAKGYEKISDVITAGKSSIQSIKGMGKGSLDELDRYIDAYFEEHGELIRSFLNGGELPRPKHSEVEIRRAISALYSDKPFKGLSLNDICDSLEICGDENIAVLKSIIGKLLAENELEYVDYRVYCVYPKFEDYVRECEYITDRSRNMLLQRLHGMTLEEIGSKAEEVLTRERVRQIISSTIAKIHRKRSAAKGKQLFDEDYYRYFFENYALNQNGILEVLAISKNTYNYLKMSYKEGKNENLSEALADENLDTALKLKIRNYLNRKKINLNGKLVAAERAAIEEFVLKNYAEDEIEFSAFCELYNRVLEQNRIPYNEKLYYTEEVERTRYNRLAESSVVLYKPGRIFRYYDTQSRDMTELFETLDLTSFENTEFSSRKLFGMYPELMEKYDLRDHFELYSLLKKTVNLQDYKEISFPRNPTIRFGTFDREEAFEKMLYEYSPIKVSEFADVLVDEFGYEKTTLIASHQFYNLTKFRRGDMLVVNQPEMPEYRLQKLKAALTEDFYYFYEIRRIYNNLFPDASADEICPYNLKRMGCRVLSDYILTKSPSLEQYFRKLFTENELKDISDVKKRYSTVQMYYEVLRDMICNLEIFEYEPSKIMTFSRLEKIGITREMLLEFRDDVADFAGGEDFFTITSLKNSGFTTKLFEYNLPDRLYASILLGDERFEYSNMMGNIVFTLNAKSVTMREVLEKLVDEAGYIDIYDLMEQLKTAYGCAVNDKYDIIGKLANSDKYYVRELDYIFADEDRYYDYLDSED